MRLIARHQETEMPVEVDREGAGYRLTVGDRTFHVDMANCGQFVYSLLFDNADQFSLVHHRSGSNHEVTLLGSTVKVEMIDPLALRRRGREDSAGEGGVLKAIMPGRIVRVLVEPGQEVAKGAGILILEAMKMENEIQAPTAGKIEQIFVKAGDTVEGGAPLAHLV